MAQTIKIKNSSVVAKVPLVGDLAYGEIALNYADGKIYYKKSDNTIQSISGGVASVSGTAPVVSSGGATPAISIPVATTSVSGYLSSTDWTTFNAKQAALGFTPYNATNPSGYTTNTGTVTSVAALTLGTTGTDVTSTVSNGSTTPVITLNLPTASASNRGALSAADWLTFNDKAPTASPTFTGNVARAAGGYPSGTFHPFDVVGSSSETLVVGSFRSLNVANQALINFQNPAQTGDIINIGSVGTNLVLQTNNTTRINIDSTGNVGIGTTSPGSKLSVVGQIESTLTGYKFPDGTVQATAASGANWTKITANTTATTKKQYVTDTTAGAFTVTLPATPAAGDYVYFVDAGNWATNNLTVARNGSTIEGSATNLIFDVAGLMIQLIYDGSTWQVMSNIGPQGPIGPTGPAVGVGKIIAMAMIFGG
jgi:hypothetical protein